MRTDKATEHAICDLVYRDELDAEQVRSRPSKTWQDNLSFYMNDVALVPLPGMDWMRSELLSDAYTMVESGIPHAFNEAFADGVGSFSVTAYTLLGESVQQAIEKMLRLQRRKAGFDEAAFNAIRMLFICGHQVQKNFWLKEFGERMLPVFSDPVYTAEGELLTAGKITGYESAPYVRHNGPWTTYPDLMRVWKSPATDFMGQPLWWIEEMDLNLDYMRSVNADYYADTGENFYKYLDELDRYRGDADAYRSYTQSISHGLNGSSGWNRSLQSQAAHLSGYMLAGSNSVVLRQAWRRVPEEIRRYSDTQNRLLIVGPGHLLLRDVPAPTWNHLPPYRDIFMGRVANEPYGHSPLEWCLNEIEYRSELRNLRLAEAYFNVVGVHIANKNAGWDQNEFIKMPGGVWMFDGEDGVKPQDVINTLPRNPVLQEAYLEDRLLQEQQNRTFGSTPNMQGEGLGQRATMTEAMLVDQRAGGRTSAIGKSLAWQMERGAMEDYLRMDQTFLEEPIEVQIEGEQGNIPIKIFAENLDFEMDVDIQAGEYGILDQQRLQGLQYVLGTLFQNPETMVHIDPRKLASKTLHRSGVDDVLRPQAEVDSIQQANMQMMQAQLAAQSSAA